MQWIINQYEFLQYVYCTFFLLCTYSFYYNCPQSISIAMLLFFTIIITRKWSEKLVSKKIIFMHQPIYRVRHTNYLYNVKCIYSEKATYFCEILTGYLFYVVTVKFTVEISQHFVAFSKYMNFMNLGIMRNWLNNRIFF